MQQQTLNQQQAPMQQSHSDPGLPAPPQIEPISSGNLPPRFDSSTCCSVYIGNIHPRVTEPFLKDLFSGNGPVKGCKLIKKETYSYGFVDYFHHRSAALAIEILNGEHLCGQPIKVNWSYASAQREDTSSHFSIFVGDLSPEVTDAALYACFSVYPTCSDARVMWDQKNDRSKGYGFVYFCSQQDAQSSINDFNGKWLGSRQIRCNWDRNGAGGAAQLMSDPMNVVELTNATTSDDSQEKRNEDAPENNLQYTTVYVSNLAPEDTSADLHRHFLALGAGVIVDVRVKTYKSTFGFVRYRSHAEAARAIHRGNVLFGNCVKCSWGIKPTPPGKSTRPLRPPASAYVHGFTAADQATYGRQLALCRALTSPHGQRQAAATQPLAWYPGLPAAWPPLNYLNPAAWPPLNYLYF